MRRIWRKSGCGFYKLVWLFGIGAFLGDIIETIYCHATFHSAAEITALLERTGFRPEERRQTVYTLVNESQPVKEGNGGGVFAVIRAAALPEEE